MPTNTAEYQREWRAKNREKARGHSRKYMQTEAGRQKNREANARYKKNNTHKISAKNILRNAIRRGEITPESRCEECGEETRLHGHHDNYLYPFEVRWLCPPCHKEHHATIIEACCESLDDN